NEKKNRSRSIVNYNEGAVRLVPTKPGDSTYIHASQIRLPYSNYIIAQAPTKHSFVDFLRMIWQYQVSVVICLVPLHDPDTCYPYFNPRRQKVVRVSVGVITTKC
ncbi:unnamed protein product, partial [Gongylonema pulchrum]|uniref:protein-tyrosine-phosphatase n=1 Tax=Gongylonema pulchrum TaxID=637853 RepID=A0A183D3Y9_9BILA